MDLIYYIKLEEINRFFKEKKYKCKIGSKADSDSISQKLIYYDPNNITFKYEITIHNKENIEISVPLIRSNYYFTTKKSSLEEIEDYLHNLNNLNNFFNETN